LNPDIGMSSLEGAAARGGPSTGGAVFVWPTALSEQQVGSLYRQDDLEDESAESQHRAMTAMLAADTSGSERSKILVDELYILLNWCEEQHLEPRQTAIVLQCVLAMLKNAHDGPDGWLSRESSFELLKDDLLSKAVGPDGSLLISVDLLERITEHIGQAFYVRWKALQWAFTQLEGSQDIFVAVTVDAPMPKMPLSQGEPIGELTMTAASSAESPVSHEEGKDSARNSKGKRSPRGGGGRKK
jgi:hypothetical protein